METRVSHRRIVSMLTPSHPSLYLVPDVELTATEGYASRVVRRFRIPPFMLVRSSVVGLQRPAAAHHRIEMEKNKHLSARV